jgi:hypothetical protein
MGDASADSFVAGVRMTRCRFLVALGLLALAAGIGSSQAPARGSGPGQQTEKVEFQLARVMYRTVGGGGSRGFMNPWWAIDYPGAEAHFLPALARLTRIETSKDSRHLPLSDSELFNFPFLLLQQPGRGRWSPDAKEARQLHEYLARGGFLLVDDFQGEYDWDIFQQAMRSVVPEGEIVEIPEDDSLGRVVFNLAERVQIPGKRHVWGGRVSMNGEPHWRGIYNDRGRLFAGFNFNMDMGDGWEHADDPEYPAEMTGQAYRLGVNYVVYAMTH